MDHPSKKLINNPNDVVTEFIEGLVETYPGLQYLDGFPDVKVVIRADVSGDTYDKVAVISGGGSGHEPAHAGFVGEGMLTAAICGDIFASPPVDSILAGIRAVTGPLGCLLIVKNYTGDRLNFGLAAELAKSEGFKVEMVIVGDDCALPPPRGIAGRRGLAGTILVHKVAGAAAAAGLSLVEVAAEAKQASEMVGTMGVALSVCTLPGQVPSDRLGPGKMELGLGIHGEPGAAVADIQPVDIVVSHVLKQILSQETNYVPITRGSRVVVMINGVMKADQTVLKRLDAPTKAPNWPVATDGDHPPAKIPVPIPPSRSKNNDEPPIRPEQLSPEGHILELAIEAAANELISLRDNLNEWDGVVGDGDCGSTMFKGASAVLIDLKKCYPLNDPAETISEIGNSIRKVMGGTSGIIYNIFIKTAYADLKANRASAFDAGLAAVSKYGGAKQGYRTLLDALIPASSFLKEKLAAGVDPVEAFVLSAEAAVAGAESTKKMQAQVTCLYLS
ncbi:dihydroxyacetone kinase [Striga asiatica]|uniref:Dihydroxyacetone kinase n=1 Tax=Striga asiatica TaxID=4170 RepID=A0A5A7QKQ3_STRAF|nr:dihydroxyacetone kinase [Striga asiatica]